MSLDADALAEMARNRGLKLVRSRVRTPTKRGFGKLGLTNAEDEPVFGLKNGKAAAKPEDVATFLRGAEVSDWKASLKEVGGVSSRKRAAKPEVRPAPKPEVRREEPTPPAEKPAKSKPKSKPEPEPKPEVRDAKGEDAPQLAALFALLDHSIGDKAVARKLNALAKAGEPVLVATQGKAVLGACGIHRTINPHRDKLVGRITILIVAEGARKRGLGRMLVQAAEERLRKLGCGLIEVTSNDRLTQAHAFYRHLGYERTSMRFAKALPSG